MDSPLTKDELIALRDWLRQINQHNIPLHSITILPGSVVKMSALLKLARREVENSRD